MNNYNERQILDDFVRQSIENEVFNRFLCDFIENYKKNSQYNLTYLSQISLERAMDFSVNISLSEKLTTTLNKIEKSYFNYEIFYTILEILIDEPELDSIDIINSAINHWDIE